MRRHRPACVVIKLLLGRCFRCQQMVDGNVHLVDDPLRLFCADCCVECGAGPEGVRHLSTGALNTADAALSLPTEFRADF
jgi:hypothetical protein